MRAARLLAAMMLLAAMPLRAQSLWTSATADFDLARNVGVYVEGELRTTDKLSSVGRWSLETGVDYKPCRNLKLGAGVSFIDRRVESRVTNKGNVVAGYWQPRYRLHLGATGSCKVGRLKLSLREHYQFTHHTGQTVAKYDGIDGTRKGDEIIEAKDKYVLRSRLKAEWAIRKSALAPFVSAEVYNSLADGFSVEKLRLTIGSDIRLAKHHDLSLFYRYVDSRDNDDPALHVMGVGYKFSL